MALLVVVNAGIAGQWTLQVLQIAAQSLAGLFSPCVAETTLQNSAKQFILLLTLLGSTCQVASSAVRAVAGVLASGYAAVEMLMGYRVAWGFGSRCTSVQVQCWLSRACCQTQGHEATVTNCEHMSK